MLEKKKNIVIIEPDDDFAEKMSRALREYGYRVRRAADGESGLELASQAVPCVVLLEVELPGESGTEICRRLKADRATAHVPIVIVTSRNSETDRVVGFELGATDYVTKPLSLRELVLRIRAILTRLESAQKSSELVVGCLRIDTSSFCVEADGRPISLTRQEFRLLTVLARSQGRVFSRGELLDMVWGGEAEVLERTVDAHIKGLRGKLGEMGCIVETVHGVGYRLSRVEADAARNHAG